MQKLKTVELNSRNGFLTGKRLFIGAGLAALILITVVTVNLLGLATGTGDLMTAAAESRDFISIVVERGALKAAETYTYSAPRLRRGGGQVILELAPEGTVVEPGDLVVRFDSASLEESVRNQRNEVDEVEAELRKTIAQQESQMASLQASLEQAQHSHEQAELSLQKLQFESVVRQEQERYNFLKSELSLQRAQEAIDTQVRLNGASLQQLQLRVDRAHQELDEMLAELELTTLYAEQPGLVIYETTFGPEGPTKIQVGDSPYSGQTVVSIPNLTTMIVQVQISELDIRKVAVGQEALVRIDAYPDTIYAASVTEISPLARRQGASQMKVFDCTVALKGTDYSLRPGMTAQVSIITSYQPDSVVIPLEAVFRRGSRSIVFTVENGIEEVEVVLGEENGNYVVVKEGLSLGTLVALRDPYIQLETLETAGTEALLQQRDERGTRGMGDIQMIMERMSRGGRGGGGDRMRIFH